MVPRTNAYVSVASSNGGGTARCRHATPYHGRMERSADHPSHLWYVNAAGVVRCALQGCAAEPTALEAAEAVAEAELAASMRVELDWTAAR